MKLEIWEKKEKKSAMFAVSNNSALFVCDKLIRGWFNNGIGQQEKKRRLCVKTQSP